MDTPSEPILAHIDDANNFIESLDHDQSDLLNADSKQIIFLDDDDDPPGSETVGGELSVSDFDIDDHFQVLEPSCSNKPIELCNKPGIETVWSEQQHSDSNVQNQLVGPPYCTEWFGANTECTIQAEAPEVRQEECEPDIRPLKRLRITREIISKKIDHHGVAMRFDGVQERFTAYYRPSYWTIDDGAVFLGEHPTFEDAKDAFNLVALVHEGWLANLDLSPFTVEKYTEDLKRWEGKHHMDLVCELRLRGRGFMEDGKTVNYKNIGRRWSAKKIRYYSTVQNDPDGGPFKKFISTTTLGFNKSDMINTKQSFDTPEEAARCADLAMVNQRGIEAWTNFPLSSYITDQEILPLTFLCISTNFRENLEQKRGRIWVSK